MFTGIIEELGTVKEIEKDGSNTHFWIEAPFNKELKIDQSIAHNGVCLTVVDFNEKLYKTTAIKETLQRTNLNDLIPGDLVNLERCMRADSRLDGHIVQGHVDTTARVTDIREESGSWLFNFEFEKTPAHVMVEKGSVTINGASLTCFDIKSKMFSVAIIPYTFEYTNFNRLKPGDRVNIEFDIIGKYVQRMMNPYVS